MDVRCEKCQTEYELDEARLKPGGVTVKCTNCGHTFRVHKRTPTNIGTPAVIPPAQVGPAAPAAPAHAPQPRPDSIFDDERTEERYPIDDAPTTVERQWLIRLENGEQKSCRELATLQQWIITGVVTRESLISRTGKTWKRLGDVADLGQYFTIADEARANRERSKPTPTPRPAPVAGPAGGPIKEVPGTIPGYSAAAYAPQAAGGTILPDDDDEPRTIRAVRGAPTPPPVPPRGLIRTPAMGQPVPPPQAAVQAVSDTMPSTGHAIPQPPPPPRRGNASGPVPQVPAAPAPPRSNAPATPPPPIPQGSRATAMWANEGIKPEPNASSTAPFIGKLSAIPDEPAFAGKVRMAPGAESSFESGRITLEDDDDLLPARRGSRTGMIVLIMALLVMGGAAAVVYVFVIRGGHEAAVVTGPKDAAVVVQDATAVVVTATPDAAQVAETPPAPLDAAHGELRADVEPRLRTALAGLDGKTDAPSQGMRAYMMAQLTQDLNDRASLVADKPTADGLRKDAKQLALDAASAAQRALKAAGDDAGANLAMAEILRLQGKPRDAKRYLDTARSKADKDWARELALAEAMQQVHAGKLDDAKAGFTAIDQGDGKLETSGDVRARFHLALVLAAQNKATDAKPLADSILAAQPEHAGAKALLAKLETQVATSDPLPPEDTSANPPPAPPNPGPGAGKEPAQAPKPGHEPKPTGPTTSPGPTMSPGGGGGSYDTLIASANKAAETSCARAMELYNRALEQKPNGVEALTGLGYCYIDAKQFSSAFSKFRTALAMSSRYEPALRGIAEGYLQQGRKDLAIEAYKHYLEVYPDNAAAKKQLERLGPGPQDAPAPPAPSPSPSPGPTTSPDSPAAGSASQ